MSPSASLPEAQGRLSPGRRSAHSASELSADAPAGVDSAETILSPLEQDARTPGPPCQPPPEGALRSIPPKWPPVSSAAAGGRPQCRPSPSVVGPGTQKTLPEKRTRVHDSGGRRASDRQRRGLGPAAWSTPTTWFRLSSCFCLPA
ncbi:formin-like protein 16 isoform X1 [Suricata suricatta]|uniref:formin-like protein 16 isoform X1 n=1 Tax=Suricata suricatta TaxID=37032 RepID=UPI001155B6E2|nr:formin-like protein 16 isoform X1 [Suricata suricatta]